jgi:hypothetical protein
MDKKEKEHVLRQMKHRIKKMIEAGDDEPKIKKAQRAMRKMRDGE